MKSAPNRCAAFGALAGLPALAILPAAAVGSSVDPIHAAIERHVKAWDRLTAACNPADEVLAEREGRKVTDAERAEHEAALEDEDAALMALAATPPSTTAGLRAALAHIADCHVITDTMETFVETLLRSPLLAA